MRGFPLRLFAYYFKVIFRYNAVFSILAFLITGFNYRTLLTVFLTMGYVTALLLFYLWREPEYYFYYNRCLSKFKLMSAAYLLSILLAIMLWFCLKKVHLW